MQFYMEKMVFNLYSKRQKKNRGEIPDVYQYENIPRNLRIQLVQLIDAATQTRPSGYMALYGAATPSDKLFKFARETLCREYGEFALDKESSTDREQILNFLLRTPDVEKALDAVELCFQLIDTYVREQPQEFSDNKQSPDSAINELNERFREHGVGFQFEQGHIIRVDSELLHSDVVRPLLAAMAGPLFKPALDEFHTAHEHYRHKRYKECLNDCLKAFESTMKIICNKKGWPIDPNATASKLIKALFDNSFLPSYLDNQATSIRQLLESGTPTIRNKNSGHGQGVVPVTVPEELASYCLHLTATNLLFLVKKL